MNEKMEINFETVRIGKFRQDMMQERILKENYKYLKDSLKGFVKTIQCQKTSEIIYVDIVIPAKGRQIKITLDAIVYNEVKRLLIKNFPDSIYKGDYSILLKNCINRPYFPFNI
jgi:hypothetical protein